MSRKLELERARSALPVTGAQNYLATGSWGPVSQTFAVTLRRTTLEELRQGRMSRERFESMAEATARIRSGLAGIVGAEPGQIALTQGTSAGLETVIRSYPFRPGDEVVCTHLEHPACTRPLAGEATRQGFNVRLAQVPETEAENLRWLEKHVSPRTRLIAVTGVSYTTGQRLPIAEIGAFAREQGIHTLVDAAQWVGAMPLDLAQAQIDFCAFPLQKWLLGPEGLGGLYVHDASFPDMLRDRVSQSRGVLEATAAHLEWLRDTIGWNWIFERTERLAAAAREAFADVAGLRLVTPAAHAGLVTVRVDPARHDQIAAGLRRRRIALRSWPEHGRYRISTAFFNTEKEVAAAARLFEMR